MKKPNFQDTERTLLQMKETLRDKYSVKELGIFGSVVRLETKPGSDIDLLVSFSKPISLFEYLELEDFLKKKMRHKIDLVMKNNLKSHIGEKILSEVRFLWNE